MPGAQGGRQRGGCVKLGCLGCGGMTVLMVATGMMGYSAIFFDGGGESDDHPRLDHDLPAGFELAPFTQATETAAETGGDPFPRIDEELRTGMTGRVVLQFLRGGLEIIPGEPGEPIRVEGDYDTNRFELKTGFEVADDGTWVYGLWFNTSDSIPRPDDANNVVKLFLPPDVPFTLTGQTGTGRSRIELGGLSVIAVDLKLGVGDHQISFSEPTPAPLESFRAQGSTGALKIVQLGNASPQSVYVSHKVGELEVDLGGEWNLAADAEVDVEVRSGIGENTIRIPETAFIVLESKSWVLGEMNTHALMDQPESGAEELPTLNVGVVHRIGEMSFRY